MESKEEYRIKLKKYLGLNNVSVLTGAGTSWHLGAPIIRFIPDALKSKFQTSLDSHFPKDSNPSLEDFINCLQAERYLLLSKGQKTIKIDDRIRDIQNWLYQSCNTERLFELSYGYKPSFPQ